jgi:hypothetical protein
MPCLQELLTVFQHLLLEPAKLTPAETARCCQGYRIEPELGQGPSLLDVDVRRLGSLIAVEEEPRGSDAKDRRHQPRAYRIRSMHDSVAHRLKSAPGAVLTSLPLKREARGRLLLNLGCVPRA